MEDQVAQLRHEDSKAVYQRTGVSHVGVLRNLTLVPTTTTFYYLFRRQRLNFSQSLLLSEGARPQTSSWKTYGDFSSSSQTSQSQVDISAGVSLSGVGLDVAYTRSHSERVSSEELVFNQLYILKAFEVSKPLVLTRVKVESEELLQRYSALIAPKIGFREHLGGSSPSSFDRSHSHDR